MVKLFIQCYDVCTYVEDSMVILLPKTVIAILHCDRQIID